MNNQPKLYPQASADGSPIPDAIANPEGYVVQTVTSTPVLVSLPNRENIVGVYVTDLCLVLLDDTSVYTQGSYQPNGFILLPGLMYTLYIDNDFMRVQHIGVSTDTVTLYANVLSPWGGAGAQLERSI
jgi:hypothetical protein